MAKFLAIKLIVMFTFYQSFVVCKISIMAFSDLVADRPCNNEQFEILQGRVIHGNPYHTFPWTLSYLCLPETQYWTETNIANGLSALTICIEVRVSWLYSSASFHISFDRLSDGLFFSIHVMGVSLLWIQTRARKAGNGHWETTLGFVSFEPLSFFSRAHDNVALLKH